MLPSPAWTERADEQVVLGGDPRDALQQRPDRRQRHRDVVEQRRATPLQRGVGQAPRGHEHPPLGLLVGGGDELGARLGAEALHVLDLRAARDAPGVRAGEDEHLGVVVEQTHRLEGLHGLERRAVHELEHARARLADDAAHRVARGGQLATSVEGTGGRGSSRTVASVITASVPSEPHSRLVRS
jgi:hypothetical protein